MNAFRIDPGIIRKRTRLIPSDLEAPTRTWNLFADECFAIEFIPDFEVFFYAVSAEIDVCNEHDTTSFQGDYTTDTEETHMKRAMGCLVDDLIAEDSDDKTEAV